MPASQLAPTSLGHVAVTRGSQAAVMARFERLAGKAQPRKFARMFLRSRAT